MEENIVIATFDDEHKTVKTRPLWQYDYGQKLKIEGISLPDVYEVHFAVSPAGKSTTVLGDETGANIPDGYLTVGKMIYAWLFLHVGTEDGETRLQITIPVNRRALPANEQPPEEQKDALTDAIALLQEAKETIENGASVAAEEAAERAKEAVLAGLDAKVDKVDGQGLSDNNFTDEYIQIIQSNSADISALQNLANTLILDQPVASDVWVLEHNLDKYPSVTIVDSAGSVVVGDVTYVSKNKIIVTFIGAFSGKAYLN